MSEEFAPGGNFNVKIPYSLYKKRKSNSNFIGSESSEYQDFLNSSEYIPNSILIRSALNKIKKLNEKLSNSKRIINAQNEILKRQQNEIRNYHNVKRDLVRTKELEYFDYRKKKVGKRIFFYMGNIWFLDLQSENILLQKEDFISISPRFENIIDFIISNYRFSKKYNITKIKKGENFIVLFKNYIQTKLFYNFFGGREIFNAGGYENLERNLSLDPQKSILSKEIGFDADIILFFTILDLFSEYCLRGKLLLPPIQGEFYYIDHPTDPDKITHTFDWLHYVRNPPTAADKMYFCPQLGFYKSEL
jgi:hypothetical protein